jgi:hypothetical protein
MKKNPFTNNNRFQFLDEENNQVKFQSSKKEKKLESYNLSNNSFMRDRQKTAYIPNRRINQNKNETSIKEKESKIFNIEEIEFPDILSQERPLDSSSSSSSSSSAFNFKDALKKSNPELNNLENQENKIKPGWVELSMENKKIVLKEGSKTPYMLKQIQREEYNMTPHYIMNTAINLMNERRERYIYEYNSYHGEGSYEEEFILPPVYGPEYDTEDESIETRESDENFDL